MPSKQTSPDKEHQLFHEFLEEKITSSGIKQMDIAQELGFDKANIITMFKQGKTRVPLHKVPAFASILGLDPRAVMRMAMLEYTPELLRAIEQVFGTIITHNEKCIIDEIRLLSGNSDPKMSSIADKEALKAFVDGMVTFH